MHAADLHVDSPFSGLREIAPDCAINRAGELYLAATDLTTPTPGVRIFDTEQETELAFVNVGQLPPNFIVFIE